MKTAPSFPATEPSVLALSPVPSAARIAARLVAIFLVTAAAILAFVPWQQTVSGTGRVVAYSPTDREQHLHAPVSGRLVRWHVVEGSRVEKGDPIVEIVDVDPGYVGRLEQRRNAQAARLTAAESRAEVYSAQVTSFEDARTMKLRASRLKVQMAEQQLEATRQEQQAAEARVRTAQANVERQRHLVSKGLVSERDVELAELTHAEALANLNTQRAAILEAKAKVAAANAEVLQVDAEAKAKVSETRAEVRKAEAEGADARNDLATVESELSRQASRAVTSPVDGFVQKIDGNEGGGIVSKGQHLAIIVPDTRSRAVELYVDGNDAPLLSTGRAVRLQFEGWPAVQFAGWPSVAVGTFGGTVSFIDPSSLRNGGRFRVLIVPDDTDQPWPAPEHLRQGVRAKGWVLLDQVRLGWELWRRFNGFPPSVDVASGAGLDPDKGASRIEANKTGEDTAGGGK